MKHIIKLLTLALSALLLLAACSGNMPENTVHTPSDLAGKTVGVLENSVTESYLSEISDKINIRKFSEETSLVAELKSGALDAIIADETATRSILRDSGTKSLDTPLIDRSYCIAVSEENTTLLKNVNDALKSLRREGKLEELGSSWSEESFDFSGRELEGESLVIAVVPDFEPYTYYDENGELAGVEIDLAELICEKLGVKPEFRVTDPDKLVYMAESGKVSLAIGRITRGDDAVLYSDTYLTSVQSIIVRKD